MKSLGIAGTIGRFKPFHNGHAAMLESICANAGHVYIGLGSPNKYDLRNPFTAKESADMIDCVLKHKYKNYSFIEVPDFDDAILWRENTVKLFGSLDCFVTSNDYVVELLKSDYKIVHPFEIVSAEKLFPVTATRVRKLMSESCQWGNFVPQEVKEYILANRLDERFRKEFC